MISLLRIIHIQYFLPYLPLPPLLVSLLYVFHMPSPHILCLPSHTLFTEPLLLFFTVFHLIYSCHSYCHRAIISCLLVSLAIHSLVFSFSFIFSSFHFLIHIRYSFISISSFSSLHYYLFSVFLPVFQEPLFIIHIVAHSFSFIIIITLLSYLCLSSPYIIHIHFHIFHSYCCYCLQLLSFSSFILFSGYFLLSFFFIIHASLCLHWVSFISPYVSSYYFQNISLSAC